LEEKYKHYDQNLNQMSEELEKYKKMNKNQTELIDKY